MPPVYTVSWWSPYARDRDALIEQNEIHNACPFHTNCLSLSHTRETQSRGCARKITHRAWRKGKWHVGEPRLIAHVPHVLHLLHHSVNKRANRSGICLSETRYQHHSICNSAPQLIAQAEMYVIRTQLRCYKVAKHTIKKHSVELHVFRHHNGLRAACDSNPQRQRDFFVFISTTKVNVDQTELHSCVAPCVRLQHQF